MRSRSFARALLISAFASFGLSVHADDRPNILWLTSEDNGPHLGCYGDTYATTPNLDGLARRGLKYTRVWSVTPVCAPARTALITGMYPWSTGSEHMRSLTRLPEGMKFSPEYLREAGYYCTNNSKEDYNLADPGQAWDESSPRAHWSNRGADQPFFAVFNSVVSHEGHLRATRPLVHDPAAAPVPPYHPDTPEVREDWARYYDNLSRMDEELGGRLRELEEAGLAENTIVFYFGDHGSGMPRHKRAAQDSGLRVPLIVYFPERYRHLAPEGYESGGTSDRLVSFVDFGPTILSLAAIRPPNHMQGRAFAGEFMMPPHEYLFGGRGRMDERVDFVRSMTDGRYVYVRNYMPHLPHGQHLAYQMETATTRVWSALHRDGQLNAVQRYFWEPKAPEELYDLAADPHETVNLAGDASFAATKQQLGNALDIHMEQRRDLGFVPEPELRALPDRQTPFEFGHNITRYPLERAMDTARIAAALRPEDVEELARRTRDAHATVRYWAALGLYMRGADVVGPNLETLRPMLNDASPVVRVVAAQALAAHGDADDAERAIETLLKHADIRHNEATLVTYALNALDYLDAKALPWLDRIKALPTDETGVEPRYRSYVARILEKTLADLE